MKTERPESEQLLLFGDWTGGLDVKKLKAERESLRGRAVARSTARNYSTNWRAFCEWCDLAGRQSLPASAETVALYTTWRLVDEHVKASTASRDLAAIADAHRRMKGAAVPAMDDAREVIAGVRRRRRERPKQKAALRVEDLVALCKGFDLDSVRGVRDRAILVLGFATSLRRSELSALQLSDVRFDGEGLVVLVGHSKTDQAGVGRVIGVWAGRRAVTDPVRVLRMWISERGAWPGPLFTRVSSSDAVLRLPISGEAIADVVKSAVARVGLDPVLYAGHSLRSGAVTASAELGSSEQELMKLSGHASASVMRSYIREVGLFRGRNPLAGVL